MINHDESTSGQTGESVPGIPFVCVFKEVMYDVSFQQWHRGPHSAAELRGLTVLEESKS